MKQLRLKDRAVSELSKGWVSYGTVNRLRHHKNDDIQLSSLHGLSVGIGVPVEDLVALAFNQEPRERALLTEEEQDLIASFRQLPYETQDLILQSLKKLSAYETEAIEAVFAPVRLLSSPMMLTPTSQKKGGRR